MRIQSTDGERAVQNEYALKSEKEENKKEKKSKTRSKKRKKKSNAKSKKKKKKQIERKFANFVTVAAMSIRPSRKM